MWHLFIAFQYSLEWAGAFLLPCSWLSRQTFLKAKVSVLFTAWWKGALELQGQLEPGSVGLYLTWPRVISGPLFLVSWCFFFPVFSYGWQHHESITPGETRDNRSIFSKFRDPEILWVNNIHANMVQKGSVSLFHPEQLYCFVPFGLSFPHFAFTNSWLITASKLFILRLRIFLPLINTVGIPRIPRRMPSS